MNASPSQGAGAATPNLTAAQLRELRCLAQTGDISDIAEFGSNHLAFHARDRVIGALARKGLIVADPDWKLTDAGRSALSAATEGEK